MSRKIVFTLCALLVCFAASAQKERKTYYYACLVTLNNDEAWVSPVKSVVLYERPNSRDRDIFDSRLLTQWREYIHAEVDRRFLTGNVVAFFVYGNTDEEWVTKEIRAATTRIRDRGIAIITTRYFNYVLSEEQKKP